ncbi:hypothetical protein [Algibacter sp. L4_22]|uniref:hypothetical protein n=1 Tax=Algibacter sp. L4_22 TaxID=2942477 RepID=UPI00201B4FF0|nr:hypothetical protein [Algibacter sp. L4_22]MCL5130330.1 hypothetical protein [Algibacter sp. L4_22]
MKKSITLIAILVSLFSLTFTSCSSDNDTNSSPEVETGSYEIYLDGVLFLEGTNAEVGLIKDDQGNYVNTVTIGTGTEVVIVVSGFPTTIGDVSNMVDDGDPGVNILTEQNLYDTRSGTLTRTSASKISFDGTCTDWPNLQSYSITGYIESEAWKVIN